jgi:DNA-binding HxlR family transcriptional regulator
MRNTTDQDLNDERLHTAEPSSGPMEFANGTVATPGTLTQGPAQTGGKAALPRPHQAKSPRQECSEMIRPVRDVLDLINGKWKLPVLIALSFGDKRFNELERDLEGITPRMLSRELRELETNGLVVRQVQETIPATVTYSLTDYGRSLDTVIASMRAWGKEHRAVLFKRS